MFSEEALAEIEGAIGKASGGEGHGWTGRTPLPGGDILAEDIGSLEADLSRRLPTLSTATVRRLVASYGTDAARIAPDGDLGPDLGHGLHAAEAAWLQDQEWARSAEDILWRRTKLRLLFTADDRRHIERRLLARRHAAAAAE